MLKTKNITLVEMLNLVSVGLVTQFRFAENHNSYHMLSDGTLIRSDGGSSSASSSELLHRCPISGLQPVWRAL
jgi:hypothetical protein